MNDLESFLADPGKIPAVFADEEFLLKVAEGMNLKQILHGLPYFHLFHKRLVPNSPVCRQAIRKLHKQDPKRLSDISLIDSRGRISSGESVVAKPVYRRKFVAKR